MTSNPTPDRRTLEELWRQRLNDAKLRLDFARNYLTEVRRDHASGNVPDAERHSAYQDALRAENLAFAEYNRVLGSYTDLTVNGIIPDEAAWHTAKATDG